MFNRFIICIDWNSTKQRPQCFTNFHKQNLDDGFLKILDSEEVKFRDSMAKFWFFRSYQFWSLLTHTQYIWKFQSMLMMDIRTMLDQPVKLQSLCLKPLLNFTLSHCGLGLLKMQHITLRLESQINWVKRVIRGLSKLLSKEDNVNWKCTVQ